MNGLIHKLRAADVASRLGMAVALLCAAGPGLLMTSCHTRPSPPMAPIVPPPLGQPPAAPAVPSVPVVRVCLTSAPVDRATVQTTAGYTIGVDDEAAFSSRMPLDGAVVLLQQGRWSVNGMSLKGRGVMTIVPAGGMVQYEGTLYRGWLSMVPADGGFLVVNHADLEGYVAGVLARELYPSWLPATYEALAVAARTYAIYQMKTVGRSRPYDLGSDVGSQVYGGYTAETPTSREAVRRTFGQVLVCRQDGRQQVFKTQYFACCGGVTNPATVLRDAPQAAPLAGGQVCSDCVGNRFYRWDTVRVSKADVAAALEKMFPAMRLLGGITWIQVESATAEGRPVWIVVNGQSGKGLRMRAEDLRLALMRGAQASLPRLPSMNCQIRDAGAYVEFAEGRGFGHGVGLCQWGAQGKATKGWDYKQILRFYYPSSEIILAY